MRRSWLAVIAVALAFASVQTSAGGATAPVMVIPAGGRAVLSGALIGGCDANAYGYELGTTLSPPVDAKTYTCGATLPPVMGKGATIGPVSSQQNLNVYLDDTSCDNATYFSDGTGLAPNNVDHALVTGANPYTVEINDAGSCIVIDQPAVPSDSESNFSVVVTITAPPSVSVTAPAPPAGQDGYFNLHDLAAAGGSVPLSVSANGGADGVVSLTCSDNGTPVSVTGQSGRAPRIGTVLLSASGQHTVVCAATDGAGDNGNDGGINTAQVSLDTNAPSLTVPASPLVVGAQGSDGALITSYAVSASDPDPGDTPSTRCTPQAPTRFPIGDTTVSCVATDRAGNSVIRQFVVRVQAVHASSTVVGCSPSTVKAGQSTTCTALVADTASSGATTPTGTIGFSSGGSGSFGAGDSCKLEGAGAKAACSVSYTPGQTPSAPVITATYAGDVTHTASSGFTTIAPVAGVTATVTVTGNVLISLPAGARSHTARGVPPSASFVPLKGSDVSVPVGSTIDASAQGASVRLATAADYRGALDRRHRIQIGVFATGMFTIEQRTARQQQLLSHDKHRPTGIPPTQLVMKNRGAAVSAAGCSAKGKPHKGIVRSLSGVAKGLYETIGAFSTTIVRNGSWVVEDRCDGTVTEVGRGRAQVTYDAHRRRLTQLIQAGHGFLVRGRFPEPAQNPPAVPKGAPAP